MRCNVTYDVNFHMSYESVSQLRGAFIDDLVKSALEGFQRYYCASGPPSCNNSITVTFDYQRLARPVNSVQVYFLLMYAINGTGWVSFNYHSCKTFQFWHISHLFNNIPTAIIMRPFTHSKSEISLSRLGLTFRIGTSLLKYIEIL